MEPWAPQPAGRKEPLQACAEPPPRTNAEPPRTRWAPEVQACFSSLISDAQSCPSASTAWKWAEEQGPLRQPNPGGKRWALCPQKFPWRLRGKESACNAGGLGLIPGSGRSPGEGNGYPVQESCLENPVDRGAWRAAVVCCRVREAERPTLSLPRRGPRAPAPRAASPHGGAELGTGAHVFSLKEKQMRQVTRGPSSRAGVPCGQWAGVLSRTGPGTPGTMNKLVGPLAWPQSLAY